MALDRKRKIDLNQLPGNPYLADPARGLRLIASLLAGEGYTRERKIGDSVDDLIGACGRLKQTDIADGFSRLRQILNLLQMPARSRLLRDTAIVGVGGQFSSGKSSILNSLLDAQADFRLPEDIKASTSIATYMMHAPKARVMACSGKGHEIALDPAALEAISHQFRSAHKINPAQYIEFIGISLPQFPVPGVALLDTPGYNASDISTQQEHRDSMRSRKALNSADHLVWLISAREPLLTSTDQRFIQNLNLSGEITVIVNKCDQIAEVYNSPDPEHSAPVENIRKDFDAAGIRVSSIIPYCAREPEWNGGKTKVTEFLHRVADGKKSAQERTAEMEEILTDLEKKFEQTLRNRFTRSITDIDACIDATDNPLELASLVHLRGLMGYERSNTRKDYDMFTACASRIRNWVNNRGTAAHE